EYYALMGTYPLFSGYTVSDDTVSPASSEFNTVIFSNVTGDTLDIDMSRTGARIGVSGIQIFGRIATPTIKNLAPTGLTGVQADLNARLDAVGGDCTAYIHWGPGDGGTLPAGWLNTAEVGTWTNVETDISYQISGLEPGQAYFYTFTADRGAGRIWASPSYRFVTEGVAASRTNTLSHIIPHSWIDTQSASWASDYETAVSQDQDGDGFTTWQEYWSGTDPNNSKSRLKIDAIYMQGDSVRVEWQHDSPDATIPPIAIFTTTNLNGGAWEYAGERPPANGTNTWLSNPSQQLFYRLVVTNTP
ncbi:hypothetical protein BVX97_00860, partial [bacterium E08(2017)]